MIYLNKRITIKLLKIMSYDIKDVVRSAKQISSNWSDQRTNILKFLEEFIAKNPKKHEVKRFEEGNKLIQVIAFLYDNEMFFWWDYVENGIIESSGLEQSIGKSQNGRFRTSILWCSDPDMTSSMISLLPIRV